MNQKTRRVMSQTETVAMHALMNQHIEWDFTLPIEERRVSYRGDWDNEKIAKTISSSLTATHARNLRQNLFGKLKDMKASDPESRIAALETEVAQLKLTFADLVAILASGEQKPLSEALINCLKMIGVDE